MSIESVSNRLGGLCPAGGGEFKPLDEGEICRIENQIGSILPIRYRSLLAQFGAFTFKGMSENNPYVFFQSKTPLPAYIASQGAAIFDFFYGSTQDNSPAGLLQQIAFFKGRIPDTMIPVASDGGAGQICLGISGDDTGKVFYWDMANEPLDEETYFEDFGESLPVGAKRQNVHLVADSLDDFLDSLVLSPHHVE